MYGERIIDIITGEEIWRDYTPEEVAQVEAAQAEAAAGLAQADQNAAKRQAALAKLEALGLDEDDLKALGF